MRPLTLELKNFGSYQSEVLSFDDFDIAVISGESGSGKSTIPDAIIWALYGRSERESVLSHAADEKKDNVEVALQFELDGQIYEINRKRGGKSDLTLYSIDEDGEKKNISAKGIKAVDAQIQELLGMDYQTFRLTAFVPQDGVTTFAGLGPAERKRFLEQFLDTSVWNKCIEKAKAEESVILCRKAVLDSEIKKCAALLDEENSVAGDVNDCRMKLENSEKDLLALSREIDALTAQKIKDEFEGKNIRRIYDNCLLQSNSLRADINAISADLKTLKTDTENVSAPSRSLDEIRSDIDAMHEAERRYSRFLMRLKESELTEKQLTEQQTAAAEKAQSYAAALEKIQSDISILQTELETAKEKIGRLDSAESNRGKVLGRLSENEAMLRILKKDLAELDEREKSITGSEGKCPVCGSEMTEEHRTKLLLEIAVAKAENQTRTEAAFREQSGLKTDVLQLEAEIAKGKSEREKFVSLSGEIGQKESSAQQTQKMLSEILEEIVEKDYAARISSEKAARAKLEIAMNDCGYSETKLNELRDEEKNAAEYEKYLRSEQKRKEEIKQLEALLASKQKDAEQMNKALSEAENALDSFCETYAERDYQRKTDDLAQRKNRLVSDGNHMRGELAKLEARMNEVNAAKTGLPVLQTELASQIQRLEDIRELIVAYGDKGIKALLIDQMLPSITKEANNILSLLSDGRFTLDMTTLKSNKKGDEVETLDILLYKDGIRDRYENLSGGEKFKVNFSLRIGLSKYLAEAADTRLDTLVVDEGFGSQDFQGRLNALRAIQSVSDRFGLILVITHFDDIRKAFDYEIETRKDVSGYSHAAVHYHPAV